MFGDDQVPLTQGENLGGVVGVNLLLPNTPQSALCQWFLNLLPNQAVGTRWNRDDMLKTTMNISNRLAELNLNIKG